MKKLLAIGALAIGMTGCAGWGKERITTQEDLSIFGKILEGEYNPGPPWGLYPEIHLKNYRPDHVAYNPKEPPYLTEPNIEQTIYYGLREFKDYMPKDWWLYKLLKETYDFSDYVQEIGEKLSDKVKSMTEFDFFHHENFIDNWADPMNIEMSYKRKKLGYQFKIQLITRPHDEFNLRDLLDGRIGGYIGIEIHW